MIRRWVAWLVVLVALSAMATLRLADRKERMPRPGPSAVRHHTPSPSGSSSNVTGGGP
jgi:hypothetical protein